MPPSSSTQVTSSGYNPGPLGAPAALFVGRHFYMVGLGFSSQTRPLRVSTYVHQHPMPICLSLISSLHLVVIHPLLFYSPLLPILAHCPSQYSGDNNQATLWRWTPASSSPPPGETISFSTAGLAAGVSLAILLQIAVSAVVGAPYL